MTKFILILFVTTACACSSTPDYEKIIVGYYCGECESNCASIFKIEKDKIFTDTTDTFFAKPESYDYFSSNTGIEIHNNSYQSFYDAVNLLPKNLKKYPDVVGCPDCFDQCGILIKFRDKEIRLDPFSPTEDFREFSEAFLKIIQAENI